MKKLLIIALLFIVGVANAQPWVAMGTYTNQRRIISGDTTWRMVSGTEILYLHSEYFNRTHFAPIGGSGVTSVSGTSLRITSTGGTTPVIDISASYAGQSSIITVGTITTGTWSGSFGAVSGANLTNLTAANISAGTAGINVTGNAGTATALQTARTINGTSFNGTANITVTAAAGTLTGTTLNPTVVTSSLTSVGTIGTGVWQGTVIGSNYGGAGAINGILKANGSGVVSVATVGTDYAAATGGTGYIQNQNSSAQTANSWISGDQTLQGKLYLNSTKRANIYYDGSDGDGFIKLDLADYGTIAKFNKGAVYMDIESNSSLSMNQFGFEFRSNVSFSARGRFGAPVYVMSSNGFDIYVDATDPSVYGKLIHANTSNQIYTLPDATGYVSLRTNAETLTNKTLTSPVINVGSDATGDIYYRSSGGAFTRLAIGGSGTVVHGGTIPSYSAVSLTADVTGILPIANGGTGVSTGVINNQISTGQTAGFWISGDAIVGDVIINSNNSTITSSQNWRINNLGTNDLQLQKFSGGSWSAVTQFFSSGGFSTIGTIQVNGSSGNNVFSANILGVSSQWSGLGNFLLTSNTGTTGKWGRMTNNTSSGGDMAWGIESSVGSTIFTGANPSAAYATVFGSLNNSSVQIAVNNSVALTFINGGAATFGSTVGLFGYTVSGLPAAGTAGRTAYVTDALTPSFGVIITGGGSTKIPVFDNGTNWVAY